MPKRMVLVVIVLAVMLASFVVLLSYSSAKQLERRPRAESLPASQVYEITEATVANTIRNLFNTNRAALNDKFGRFYLVPAGDSLFPDEFQLQAHKSTQSYASIESALRKNDFYLHEPTGDYYWDSEYYYKGKPARFRCAFIIHIEPAGSHRTRIGIFEYVPTVWIGKRFDISGHSGPGFYKDIREVEPTASDAFELMDTITKEFAPNRGR